MKFSANPSILKNDDPAQLAWEAIAPIWDRLPYRRFSTLEKFMAELTEGQGGLTAVDWCQKEIRNGGFHQLLANPTGNLVPWAISGFGLIGADKYKTVLLEIASMLGTEFPESDAARRKALDRLSQAQITRIEELEQEFFALLNSEKEDLEKYRGKFVIEHPDQFVRQRSKPGIFQTIISSVVKKMKKR